MSLLAALFDFFYPTDIVWDGAIKFRPTKNTRKSKKTASRRDQTNQHPTF